MTIHWKCNDQLRNTIFLSPNMFFHRHNTKSPSKTVVALLSLMFWIVQGCAGRSTMSYNLDTVEVNRDGNLSKYVLDIEFEDLSYSGDDRGDKLEQIPMPMSRLIARHLRERGTFKDVVYNNRKNADYCVVGKVTGFIGFSYPDWKGLTETVSDIPDFVLRPDGPPEALLIPLVIFLLMATDFLIKEFILETPVSIDVKFSEMAIYSRDGSRLCALEDICHNVDREIWCRDCGKSVYVAADSELRTASAKLAEQIEAAIINAGIKSEGQRDVPISTIR